MLIRGATREQIEQALRDTNVRYGASIHFGWSGWGQRDLRPANVRGDAWRFVLRIRERQVGTFSRRRLYTYCRCCHVQARECASTGRKPGRMASVCWHGHRAFMRALFALAPDARITTGVITYKGSEDFERTHDETGYRNIGSQMAPIAWREACDCGEVAIHAYVAGDTYGADEAHGAANAAMANALRVGEQIARERREARQRAQGA